MLASSDNYVAAVMALNFPFHIFNWTGNLSVSPFLCRISSSPNNRRHPALSATLFTVCGCVCYLYRSCFFGGRRWFSVWSKLLRSLRIVCGRCSRCRGFHTDVIWYGKTVQRTGFFSRTFLVTGNWRFSSSRTWDWFGVSCSVASVNEIWRGPQTPIVLKDVVGDLERELVGSGAVERRPSGTDQGSSWVISLSCKLYLLRTTSCAATQPTKSKTNLASVTIRSLTGACSAVKPCSSSWRVALKKSVVEIRPSKLTRTKSVGESTIEGTLFRVSGCGGAERGSGRTFHVPVPDRTADALTATIREWIEPSTTAISDCWGAYRDLDSLGYTHRTVNHSLYFVDPDTGDHTNIIESTWHRLKVFLGPYNRAEDDRYHLADYMFAARCNAQGIPPFLQFLHIVVSTDWSRVQLTPSFAPAMWCSCRGHPYTTASPQTGMVPHNTHHL